MPQEEKSTGQQIEETILGPLKRGAQSLGLMKPDPPPQPESQYSKNSRAASNDAATASFAKKPSSDPSYTDHQAPRKERLARKYGPSK